MTSFGAIVDDTVKIEGQVHHWLGTLCPPPNEQPRFLQMYIYDTENEVSNRLHAFTSDRQSRLKPEIVAFLLKTLEMYNKLVRLFRTARDVCSSTDVPHFNVCLYGSKTAMSPDCIGAIVSDGDPTCCRFDIIIRQRDGGPQRINKLHQSYMPLQYPLLFIHGESGWSPDLRLRDRNQSQNKKMTTNMYYSYLLHDRSNVYSLLLRGGRLLQQYIVDAYVCIEESRLDYYRMNQNVFRTEFLQGVHDAVQHGDTEGRDIDKRIVLPSSFIGGPRYMYKHYQDALAICRVHGNPQYFITFTCNVKWPKIERYMARFPSLKAQDRPDIIARVFQRKVKSIMNFLKTNKPFGDVAADLYMIEFQKRGLPHCHLLLWVTQPYRIKDASDVDNYISAEIPNPILEPQLYKIVTDLMIHGPCGIVKPDAPCMSSGSCSKNYPKEYQEVTSFDDSGYVHYRRQSTGFTVTKNGMKIDNGYVVPYNRVLSMHYMAHINVEYCGWSMLIKYLFKYISKGVDRIHYTIKKSPSLTEDTHTADSPHVDEIRNFLDARFICPHEASWSILNF
ncbi:uncharacterized protein LOC110881517 [Helianthus annuus]|uniref:uncharacterized protein LOC110881517 n=1 Tax=Helianthus annuus TaxID=4232 RepID=UPI0016533920|nr:uncharacterized protein LOC110881517 [Helianthus annuus]